MNISLTPELEKFVQEKVNCGLYTSASEVVRESLRLLGTYEELHNKRLEQLNQMINVGMDQLRRGKVVPAAEAYQRMQAKIDAAKREDE